MWRVTMWVCMCGLGETCSTLRSPHIVFFYGACFEPSMYIVLDFCHKGTLSDVLENVLEYWSWTRVLRAMIDATKGLLCLHGWKPAIVHRDLKTLNLLVCVCVWCFVACYCYCCTDSSERIRRNGGGIGG